MNELVMIGNFQKQKLRVNFQNLLSHKQVIKKKEFLIRKQEMNERKNSHINKKENWKEIDRI